MIATAIASRPHDRKMVNSQSSTISKMSSVMCARKWTREVGRQSEVEQTGGKCGDFR